MRSAYKMLICTSVLFCILFILGSFEPVLRWDENTYLSNARSHIGESHYTEDFRFPLLSFMIGSLWRLTGESFLVAKLFVMLVTCGVMLLLYYVSRHFFSEDTSLLISCLFALNPLVFEWGNKVYTDFLGLFFVMLSFLLFLKARYLYQYFIVGILCSLAFLARFTYALWAFSVALAFLFILLFQKRRIRTCNRIISSFLGFSVVIVPWMLYHKSVHRQFLWNVIQQFNIVGSSQVMEPVYLQLLNYAVVFNVLGILVFIGLYLWRSHKSLFLPASFFLLHLVYVLFFVKMKTGRYLIPIVPFILLFSFIALRRLSLFSKGSVKVAVISIIFILTFFPSAVFAWGTFSQAGCKSKGSVVSAIDFIHANTGPEDSIVSNMWPYFGYADNLNSHSLYTEDLERLRIRHHPSFVIYHSSLGYPFNKTLIDSWSEADLVEEFSGCDGVSYIYRVSG